MTEPLFVTAINGRPVRFFRTPLDDGRPDFPWVSFDDLLAAACLPRAQRRLHAADLRRDWKDCSRTVGTEDSVTTIVPHFCGQGFSDAIVESCRIPQFRGDYDRAAIEGNGLITRDMPDEDAMRYMVTAFHRWDEEGDAP